MIRTWTLLGLLITVPAAAQPQPRPAPLQNGQPPLSVEPGDFWADVRSWDEQTRRRLGRNAAPATPGRGEAAAPATPPPATRPRRPAQRQGP
jgi:hypothetical protein